MATQLALAGLSYLPGGGLLISTVNTASSTTTSVLKSAWTGRPSTSTSTSTTRRTSASTFFARSPSVGYEDSSLESASSLLAPSTPPPPPATSPPLRPLMLSTLRQHRTTHHHHHQQRSSVSMGGPDVMMLGTTCSGCGSHVQVQVPPWMLSAIEGSQQRYSDTWRDDADHYHPSTSGPLAAGARAPRMGEQQQQAYRRQRQADWRSTIVHTAIGTAHAIKASPIPGLILTFFRAMFAFALLLDARFLLHQRAAIILSRFLEGLVEIEKEVGVMRGAGEALSIGWEATVKGIIAFAKADSFANTHTTYDQPRKSSQPTTSIFTRQQQQQPSSQHYSREQAPSSYFPPYQETHTYTAAKPAEPAPFFGTNDYPRHVFTSGPSGGVLADSEEDEQLSTSSPRLGVDFDYSHETSCPPSPPPPSTSTAHGRADMAHPRPLRRTPMSSPALQSAYLAQSGSRNPAGLPTSASATFGASSSSSSTMATYPFLASSSSPTETLLPPYDVAAAATTGRATKPHPLHHSAVAGSSSSCYGTTDGSGGALHLRHHRSRSGPGNTQGGDGGGGLYLEPGGGGELLSSGGGAVPGPPPPSPVGSRAGWAGKAMLGLAERMKVI